MKKKKIEGKKMGKKKLHKRITQATTTTITTATTTATTNNTNKAGTRQNKQITNTGRQNLVLHWRTVKLHGEVCSVLWSTSCTESGTERDRVGRTAVCSFPCLPVTLT